MCVMLLHLLISFTMALGVDFYKPETSAAAAVAAACYILVARPTKIYLWYHHKCI